MTPAPTLARSKRIALIVAQVGWAGYFSAACREEGGLSPWVSGHRYVTLRLSFSFLFSLLCAIISVNHVFPSCPNIWLPTHRSLFTTHLRRWTNELFFTPFYLSSSYFFSSAIIHDTLAIPDVSHAPFSAPV
jgi:hypothetical protein